MNERQGPIIFFNPIFFISNNPNAACNQEMTTRDIYLRKYNYILLTAVQHESMKYDIHLNFFFIAQKNMFLRMGPLPFNKWNRLPHLCKKIL